MLSSSHIRLFSICEWYGLDIMQCRSSIRYAICIHIFLTLLNVKLAVLRLFCFWLFLFSWALDRTESIGHAALNLCRSVVNEAAVCMVYRGVLFPPFIE